MAKSVSFKFIGCPGGGKTTALLQHIIEPALAGEFFGERTPPEQMIYSTFTKAGAHEAQERAIKRFGFDVERFPFFRTLHAICYRLLGLRREEIVSGKLFREFCKANGFGTAAEGRPIDPDQADQLPDTDNEDNLDGDCYMEILDLSRSRMRTLEVEFDAYDPAGRAEIDMDGMMRFQTAYAAWKLAEKLMDFSDMIGETLKRGLVPSGVRAVIIDEAQDLSPLQHTLVEAWIKALEPTIIAFGGDEDQEIYNWAGSRGAWLVEKPVDVLTQLKTSWRVPQVIADVALRLIGRNVNRTEGKTWESKKPGGDVSSGSGGSFPAWIEGAESSFVLARNRYIARRLKSKLVEAGIPHAYMAKRNVGSAIPAGPAVLLELAAGGLVSVRQFKAALAGVPQDPWLVRGFKAGLDKFEDQDKAIRLSDVERLNPGAEFLRCLKDQSKCLDPLERITPEVRRYSLAVFERIGFKGWTEPAACGVGTIYGAKGLEADKVLIDLGMSKRTFRGYMEDKEPERRVWYVGATRAKSALMLVKSSPMEKHFHELTG